MDLVHFLILLIYKQQVLFHFVSFSQFRCSCSQILHSKNVELFEKLEKTAFLSLAEKRKEKSSSAVVEIVVCYVLLNFRYLFDCNLFQTFSQSNREGVSSSLTNAKNHISFFLEFHQLLPISRFQICFHFHRFSQFSNEKVEIKSNSKRALQMQLRFR